jgi:hypothetical protein
MRLVTCGVVLLVLVALEVMVLSLRLYALVVVISLMASNLCLPIRLA